MALYGGGFLRRLGGGIMATLGLASRQPPSGGVMATLGLASRQPQAAGRRIR